MKKYLIWACAALTAMVCMTACDETTYVSYPDSDFPEYLTVSSLPDSCKMEVVKVRYDYYACIENAWVEITDSATIKDFQESPDKAEIKKKLKEIESQLKQSSSSKKNSSSSSSKNTDEEVESSDSEEEEEYNEEDDVCTGRHCGDGKSGSSKKKNNNDNSDDSSSSSSDEGGEGGEGGEESSSSSDEGGEGGEEESSSSGSEPELDCSEQVFDPDDYFCDDRDGHVYKKVTVGTQIWMADNLVYQTSDAVYYDEDDSYSSFGYFYPSSDISLACPSGWHVPTSTEWAQAMSDIDATEFAEIAEIERYGYMFNSVWYNDGSCFWASDQYTSGSYSGKYHVPYFIIDETSVSYSDTNEGGNDRSNIRCVKDSE